MEQAIFDKPPEIILTGVEKVEHDGNWRTHQDKTSQTDKNRGQAFSMISEQFTQ